MFLNRIIFSSIILSSLSSFALSLPPRMNTDAVQPVAALESALDRSLTAQEVGALETAIDKVIGMRAAPQLAGTLFGYEIDAMACGVAQGNALYAKAGGMACVDLTNEPGTRYLMEGGQATTGIAVAEGGVAVILYVGPIALKPYVGQFVVAGAGLNTPWPILKMMADVKIATNTDYQFMAVLGGTAGANTNVLPFRWNGGALAVQKIDWLGWAHGHPKN